MGQRRMFSQKITESGSFLEMPLSSQALYFHLCMGADDDGFVKNPKFIARMIGASDDDYKLLLAKNFAICYENGIIVIKHWRIHNLMRKDRYQETEYTDEKAMLYIKPNGAYTLDSSQGEWLPEVDHGNQMATKWQPNGNQMATQDKLSKDKLSKDKLIEKKEKNAEETSAPAPSKRKTKFGEFKNVSLTEEELDKLKTEHGSQETEEAIRILDEYMETSGKKYKSCYLALKKWGFRAVAEQGKKQKTKYDEVDEWLAQQNNLP